MAGFIAVSAAESELRHVHLLRSVRPLFRGNRQTNSEKMGKVLRASRFCRISGAWSRDGTLRTVRRCLRSSASPATITFALCWIRRRRIRWGRVFSRLWMQCGSTGYGAKFRSFARKCFKNEDRRGAERQKNISDRSCKQHIHFQRHTRRQMH